MRKTYFFMLILAISILAVGCSSDETAVSTSSPKPVKIEAVNQTAFPVTLEYIGLVDTKATKNFSFKSSGRIAAIQVQKGQAVKAGDQLAQLDQSDLQYAVKAAKAQLDSAKAQYDQGLKGATDEQLNQAEQSVQKAQDAYDFAKETYDELKALHDNGAISKKELDQAELEMNLRNSDLEIAKQALQEAKNGVSDENKRALLAQVQQAQANYDQKVSMLNDSTLIADADGYVVEILFEPGEMVSAGHPVVILRNDSSIVNVGLSQEDIDKVELGMKAAVEANDKSVEGKVTLIDSLPDPATRTYNIEIELEEDSFRIGMITDVTIFLDEKEGIWIPITSLMKNDQSYVYVVEHDQIVKKTVELGATKNSMILVKGLSDGDQLVVDGIKSVTEGDKVTIKP